MLDPDEACDASLLGGVRCQTLNHPGGTLRCTPLCTFDLTACDPLHSCGDGFTSETYFYNYGAYEWCEPGIEFHWDWDCMRLGFAAGELACAPNCTLDTSSCRVEIRCGDGFVDSGEGCDDGNTRDGDGCSADCFQEPTCGNGTRDPAAGEACDASDLGGATCLDLGFMGGLLGCDPISCEYDTSGCEPG